MNEQRHRLVFSRRLGMLVAVAENASAQGKSASGNSRAGRASSARRLPRASALGAAALAGAAAGLLAMPLAQAQTRPPVVFASQQAAPKAPLPVPYGTTRGADGKAVNATPRAFVYNPAKGAGSADLAASGQVSWTKSADGKTGTFDQGSVERVVINWDSFDIGAGYKVQFKQDKDPAKYVSALNRIWSADPSVILGALTADREVILLNANGVYFGRGAQVDTGKFVATANAIADSVFNKGLRNITDGSAVFGTAGTDYQATNLNAAISVEAGAEIRSAAGGDVLLIAPRVVNQGRIATPQGQAVLAAGDKVYLMSSSDPKQRGLIVAVDPVLAADGKPDATLGTVENAATGSTAVADGTGALVSRINEIRAESGSVNLVGLTVRQSGQINATTAVKGANGVITLQAMASTVALDSDTLKARGLNVETSAITRVAAQLGTVDIAAGSVTAVRPDTGSATQLDAEAFNPSRIRVEGAAVSVGRGAQLLAPSGQIALLASSTADNNPLFNAGAGGTGKADASRIVIAPDAVISAAGVQNVEVDGSRNQAAQRLFRIELADAAVQRASALYRSQVYFDLRDASKVTVANVSGAAASVARTAQEKSTAGGSIQLLTDGALVVGDGATLDVSGGSVHYGAATLQTSVLSQDGRLVSFSSAAGNRVVDAVSSTPLRVTSPAYTEGASGGALTLSGRQMAVAGDLQGHTTVGERQRDGRSNLPTSAALTMGLRDGNSYYINNLLLLAGGGPAVDASFFADPLAATLPALDSALSLSLPQLAEAGFGRLALRATHISQPSFGTLDLGTGGALDIEASTVQLDGRFSAAGGSLSITTPFAAGDADRTGDGDIRLSGRSRLDVSGRWTNDSAAAESGTGDAIQVKGGNVSVKAAHSLLADAGLVVDASAGARLSGTGTLTKGTAGSITLASGSNPLQQAQLQIDGSSLRALDFGSGGKLSLSGPALSIGAAAPAGGWTLPGGLLDSGGFGSITLNALGDLRVASGTTLAPQLLNWQLAEGYRGRASGDMAGVAAAQRLDSALTEPAPVNLTLNANRPLLYGGGTLSVERGASIVLAPGATLALNASRSLSVGAEGGLAGQTSLLQAQGGTLNLSITGNRGGTADQDPLGFLPDQALWLGTDARLNVDGVAQLRRDSSATAQLQFQTDTSQATPADQRVTGTVRGGGAINLAAQRGYVVAETGARLSLDGVAARLNVSGLTDTVTVAKSAGSLSISSPEGLVLNATVSAQAPRNAAGQALADGGKLTVELGAGGVRAADPGAASAYPAGARVLAVSDTPLPLDGATPGSNLVHVLGNGQGRIGTALLRNAGWSGLNLAAGDQLRFDTSLGLSLPLGVQLNAPAIAAAPGVQVNLSGSTAQIGDASLVRTTAAAASTGSAPDTGADRPATLQITASTIDLYGNVGLQGWSTVTLDTGSAAAGEIRFSAAAPNFGRLESLQRQLNFDGLLALRAGQVYATTATQYTLQGASGSTLQVRRAGATGSLAAPLSAYGSLTVNATDIDQGGVLRQPFGRLTLNATGTLTLGDNSLTSVSGDGTTVLYGQTLNLASWQLPGDDAFFSLASDKAIRLSAARFDTAASAVVSTRGGGTVLAREFFPGVGGSTDYYASKGLYAVLPDYQGTQSLALDGGIVGSALYGQQIVITQTGSGLAPGRYTLLPAYYALLGGALPSGAYLVSLAADQGKSVLRAPVRQDDGSTVVTGYVSRSGSVTTGAPGQRFVVESAATYQAKSDVRLTDVSSLLQRTAQANSQSVPALPRDAGALTLASTAADGGSRWQAQLDLTAVGGRAGTLDVSAPAVALVDTLDKAPSDALALRGTTLAASGAGSVLLGGTRQAKASGDCSPVCINASGTQRTTVDLGTQALQLEELLLAATDEVSLAAGTSLRANSSGTLGARTLASQGDGVLLAVSANALTLPRSGTAGATGALTIAAGSTLAGATVALDATGSTALDPSLSLQAGALTLSARQLVVGSAAAVDAGATVLDGKLLTAARDSRDLSLRAYTGIDFAGAQDWSQRDADTGMATHVKQRLVLDAPQLRGVAGADGSAAAADISAQTVVLRNSTGQVAEASATGGGTLTLQALPALAYGSTGGLAIGPGAQRLGFDSTALRSSGDLVLQGSGSLAAQGALTLSSARVTATTGAEQTLTAAGALRVATEAGSRTLGERVGSGASITLAGATLAQDGRIELPGGQLSLQASGGDAADANLRFGAGSLTSVASFTLDSGDGLLADGQAGRLSASTASGRIAVLGTLDASAAARSGGTGDGGRISLQASGDGGTLQLQATQADGSTVTGQLLARSGSASGDLGGQLQVDVQQLASADTLAQASTAGGISGSWALRVRTGDVTLDSSLRAQRISLAADNGTLTVGRSSTPLSLDARARSGGVLQLGAGQDLVLGAGVQLLAGATAPTTAIGGDILLASRDGWLRPATTAVVDAQGSDGIGGRIVLRASRDDTAGTVAVGRLNTSQLRAAEVAIEAVRVYDGIDTITSGLSSGGTLGQTSVARDNAAFMARAPGIAEALGVASADAGRVRVRTGVEVRGEGDIVLDTDWDLARDRAGGEAGFLTVRAAGNLFIDATLSDGFASTASIVGTDRRAALNGNTRSWSMRLAAGADLSATLPTTVQPHTGQDDETATLAIAAGKMVRTGAGSIELAAGRDVQFLGDDGSTPGGSAPAGQAYVAGRGLSASEAPAATLFPGTTNKPLFSTGGGRLAVSAERDITAPEATQLINNWYWRSGLLSTTGSDVGQYRTDNQLAWWSQFDRFKQTLGSFAGGSLRVEAGRDLLNVQAVAPTAGWADSRNPATASVHTLGGGEVTASAGRDVAGGQFLLGGGVGRLDAGRQVRNASDNVSLATPVLALNDGQWRLSGRSGIAVTSPFNPTAVSAAEADNRSGASGFFYTWGAGAGLSAVSNAGAILLQGGPTETPLQALGLAVAAGDDRSFQVTVPTLRLTAAGGDLTLLGGDGQSSAVMFPSASGQLSLWAGGNLRLGGEVSGQLAMSDSAPASFPTALSPATPGNDNTLVQSLILATLSDSLPLTGLHANDSEPVRLHAEQALQVRGKALGRASTTLLLPKAAVLSAGTDITELSLRVQQLSADDETRITAGRHLQALAFGQVEVAGPGALSVTAGQDLDLGASAGITTTGNLYSASLPAGGASVSLRAAASGTVDLNVLQANYLRDGANPRAAQYRSALLAYVREALKSPALDDAQAWAQFQRFPAQAQAALAQQLLAAEFSAVYLAGSTPTAAQYTSALKATFERLQAQAVAGIEQALAQGTILRLPGVAADATVAQAMAALPSSATAGLATGGAPITAATDPRYQAALQRYLTSIRALSFAGIDTDAQVSQRIGTLAAIRSGWREATAASLGSTAAALDALAIAQPQDARVQAWQAALADTTSARFLRYRDQALQQELDSTGRAGSAFSAAALPMRNAFYAQGLQVADLAGLGSGIAQPVWQSAAPLLAYNGALDMTQSAVVTERGGNIRLLNPGGAITVGLKDTSGSAGASTAKGVIALGGGNILGYARDDFQVNTQRVFVVGQGDMGIFTVNGDIDSGRGANTAVAAPPLVARRAVDGVVFETPATTTGSGLGILENAQGQRSGTIGLYPAFGEILALDAFIRAPSVVLGASIKGADNLQSASVGGAAAAVAAPVLSVSAPASQQETRTADAAAAAASAEARPRNALLTVDLLGLGPDGTPAAECSEAERRDGKCPAPPKPCSTEDKAKGLCK